MNAPDFLVVKEILISPFLLGLSVGIYCFAHCIPFVAPVMVSQAREKKENFVVIGKFIVGRFLGYLSLGAVFGYLGEKIQDSTINFIITGAMILLSLALVLHALGLIKSDKLSFCAKIKKHSPKIPLLMGFFMGIHICPPFLMSLTYVFSLHSAWKGIIYFLMFFIATSVYFVPIVFLGYLNKMKEFQLVGRISALIIGTSFFVYCLYVLVRGLTIF